MASREFSKKELKRAEVLKNAQIYRKSGYRSAVFLRRDLTDYENHLFSFLIDLNICLLPVYLWGVEFLLIVSGMIPPVYFDLLFYIMYGLLFLTSCILLPLHTARSHGYSWGGRITGLKLTASNARPAQAMKLVLRQLFDFGVPLMVFGYFFSIFGILGWWAINGLCVLLSPRQQTVFDWIFSTVLVISEEYTLRIDDEPAVEEEPAVQQTAKPEEERSVEKTEQEPADQNQPAEEESEASIEPDSPIDLHIRSIYSDDGSFEVEEIFRQAREKGLEVISITDHNNARANGVAEHFASLYGIRYIPGVEIDASLYNCRVRILGYYINWQDPYFNEIEVNSLRREKEAGEQRVACFEEALGVKVDTDAMLADSRFKTVTGQDLTELVFSSPQGRQLPPVRDLLACSVSEKQAMKSFQQKYFGPGGACYVKRTYPDAVSVIKAIHKAGGLAVLAGWNVDKMPDEVLEGLLEAGIDGVEVFVPGQKDETKKLLLAMAGQEKLMVTAGSDYHGSWKPDNHLGVTTATAKSIPKIRVITRALDSKI